MSATEATLVSPAYAPFDTFEGFIDTLQQVTVPTHVDRALMSKMSGALQGHLIATLRFLKLINHENETQESLQRLVQAYKTANWKAVLSETIEPAYAPIIGDLNLKSGTAKKLRERFKETSGLDGATLDKATRFYLKALKAAGVELSPHFFTRKPSGRRPSANGRPRPDMPPIRESLEGSRSPAGGSAPRTSPEGTISLPVHFPGRPQGSITVPTDLQEEDLPLIEAALGMVKAYAKANSQKQG